MNSTDGLVSSSTSSRLFKGLIKCNINFKEAELEMDNPNYLKMAQFISELRKERKLTQKELADQLGITDKAVSKWERGLSCPDISLLPRLSQLLGVTTSELLNGERTEPSAPEVEAMINTTLQYAVSATKLLIGKNRIWRFVAIASSTFLLSILVIIGCNWAIENSWKWFILPFNITAIVWLVIMLGIFIMGKNKIASLLFCGFIIFLTTFYYSSLNQVTARDISAYGEFNGFTVQFIPHYTIIIVLFIFSLAVTVVSLFIQNRSISGDQHFLLVTINITFIILTILTLSSIMDYVDIHGLGVNPKFTILSLLMFLMNGFSLALVAKRYRTQKVKEKKTGD